MAETTTTKNITAPDSVEPPIVYLPRWTAFLNSLATSGGNILMLFVFSCILMSVVIPVMIYYGPASPSVIALVGTFGTFTGALVGILRGNRVDAVPSNMTSTTTTSTSTIPPPPAGPIATVTVP